MSTEKLYDLSQLSLIMGDGEGIRMMLNIFLESTPKILEELNDGFAANDIEKISRSAHKLKASLDMMKIETLYNTIRKVDRHENVVSNMDQLPSIIEKINSTLDVVFSQLRTEPLIKGQG